MNIITRLAVATLHVCRLQLGFDTPICLFEETCTPFAQRQLEERALPIAVLIITWRLLRCNPITGIVRWVKRKIASPHIPKHTAPKSTTTAL